MRAGILVGAELREALISCYRERALSQNPFDPVNRLEKQEDGFKFRKSGDQNSQKRERPRINDYYERPLTFAAHCPKLPDYGLTVVLRYSRISRACALSSLVCGMARPP